jgi:hypothetical protein
MPYSDGQKKREEGGPHYSCTTVVLSDRPPFTSISDRSEMQVKGDPEGRNSGAVIPSEALELFRDGDPSEKSGFWKSILGSGEVERAGRARGGTFHDVEADHGGGAVGMADEVLNGADCGLRIGGGDYGLPDGRILGGKKHGSGTLPGRTGARRASYGRTEVRGQAEGSSHAVGTRGRDRTADRPGVSGLLYR